MSTNQHEEKKDRFLDVGKIGDNRVYRFTTEKQYTFKIQNLPKRISRQSHVKHAK